MSGTSLRRVRAISSALSKSTSPLKLLGRERMKNKLGLLRCWHSTTDLSADYFPWRWAFMLPGLQTDLADSSIALVKDLATKRQKTKMRIIIESSEFLA